MNNNTFSLSVDCTLTANVRLNNAITLFRLNFGSKSTLNAKFELNKAYLR